MQLPSISVMQKTLHSALPEFVSTLWEGEVESTNKNLMQQARTEQGVRVRPCLLGAHFQSKGKGRAGRNWTGMPGSTLMFSCSYDVMMPAQHLAMLAPVAGIAVAEQLRKDLPEGLRSKVGMKWPNDIQYEEGKLAGLLVESVRPANRVDDKHFVVVVGMGMNLSNAQVLSQSLGRKVSDWTSVLGGVDHSVGECIPLLVARIAMAWQEAFALCSLKGFAPFAQRFEQLDTLSGKTVNVIHDKKILFSGIASGLNEQACLIVKNDGGEHPVTIGDISIRQDEANVG